VCVVSKKERQKSINSDMLLQKRVLPDQTIPGLENAELPDAAMYMPSIQCGTVETDLYLTDR
jgi:hypothetical protein